jgi:hypothetical protein
VTVSAGRGAGALRPHRSDTRWLLLALALALGVFLVALTVRDRATSPPASELPTPSASEVAPGRPDPTTARLRVGEYLRVTVPGGPDAQYGTVISNPPGPPQTILDVVSAPNAAPQVQAVAPGTVLVTVLLEPRCPPSASCHEYRSNLGAVRVTVTE